MYFIIGNYLNSPKVGEEFMEDTSHIEEGLLMLVPAVISFIWAHSGIPEATENMASRVVTDQTHSYESKQPVRLFKFM